MNAIQIKQDRATATAALKLKNQQNEATTALAHAIKQLTDLPARLNGRDDAVRTLTRIHAETTAIDVDAYLILKMGGYDTQAVFERPVGNAITALSGTGILDVPHDIGQMRRTVENVPKPDMAIANAILIVEKDMRTALGALRLMQKTDVGLKTPAFTTPVPTKQPPTRRSWLLSAWPVTIIFVIALLYAAVYFVFKGSQVHDPLSADGASKVLDAGKSNLVIMKTMVTQTDNLLEALRKLLEHLIKLISKVPPLIGTFGVAYAAVRKLVR